MELTNLHSAQFVLETQNLLCRSETGSPLALPGYPLQFVMKLASERQFKATLYVVTGKQI